MHRLHANRAIPHPLEPALALPRSGAALPPPLAVPPEPAPEVGLVAGAGDARPPRGGEGLAEEGPRGAGETPAGRHYYACVVIKKRLRLGVSRSLFRFFLTRAEGSSWVVDWSSAVRDFWLGVPGPKLPVVLLSWVSLLT